MKMTRGTTQATTILVALVITLMLTACGISSIKCYIETDEELFDRVLENHLSELKTEIQHGLPTQDEQTEE